MPMTTTETPTKTEAKDATKPTRQTWIDLLPEGAPPPNTDDLLTRAELVAELAERGVDVDPGTLVFWERRRILPRPVRRHRGGAPNALYPRYAIHAVKHIRDLQGRGRTLDQIAPVMRAWALSPVLWQDPLGGHLARARTALLELAAAVDCEATAIRVQLVNDAGEPTWTHEVLIPRQGDES
jgi:DNA-binding transcriptional MerR regulator